MHTRSQNRSVSEFTAIYFSTRVCTRGEYIRSGTFECCNH